MFKVELKLELASGRTLWDTVIAKSEKHLKEIRAHAREFAPLGSTQTITARRI